MNSKRSLMAAISEISMKGFEVSFVPVGLSGRLDEMCFGISEQNSGFISLCYLPVTWIDENREDLDSRMAEILDNSFSTFLSNRREFRKEV